MSKYGGFVSGVVVLVLALIAGYLAMDRKVTALSEAAMTPAGVEHIVELKTTDKLEAIQRSLSRIENNIQRLQDAERSR